MTVLRPLLINALVVILGCAFIYSAWMAVKNVLAGGYPKALPQMVERLDVEGRVAVTVPAFWRVERPGYAGSILFADPLGEAFLTVRVEPEERGDNRDLPSGRPANAGQDALTEEELRDIANARWLEEITSFDRVSGTSLPPERLELGGNVFYQFSTTASMPVGTGGQSSFPVPSSSRHVGGAMAAWDVYITSLGGRLYVVEFLCPQADHVKYAKLTRRIVASLRPSPAGLPR